MTLGKFSTLINTPKQDTPAPKPEPKAASKPKPTKEVEVKDIMPPETLSTDDGPVVTLERDSDTELVATWAANHTTARVEIIGSWVWLTYPDKPAREELDRLKANGFRWARKRKQWAHSCNTPAGRRLKVHPRTKYGSVVVKDDDDA